MSVEFSAVIAHGDGPDTILVREKFAPCGYVAVSPAEEEASTRWHLWPGT